MANSLVGTIIIAVMLLASCTVPKILFIRGNKNAAVLPVPEPELQYRSWMLQCHQVIEHRN